jgi:hypothetical protein
MFRKIIWIGFCLATTVFFGQVGGKSVYQFLNLMTSARQAALGGKVVTIYDNDVNQSHFNPATINPEMNGRLALNYGNYFGDVTYGTAGYAFKGNRNFKTIFVGANYVNYGKMDGYDENGQSTVSFTGSEAAINLGSSYKIPNKSVYVGANAKLISSVLESYKSLGIATDIGVLYVDKEKEVNWAFVIRNVGTQLSTYAGTKEKLPMEVMFGVSQQMQHVPIRWHLALENLQQWNLGFSNPNRAQGNLDGTSTPEKVSFFNNALRHVVMGAEFFPKKGFNLRLGYNFRRGEELKVLQQRSFSGLSFGFGLKMGNIKFNYSYSKYTLAANTSLFGLTFDFSRNK